MSATFDNRTATASHRLPVLQPPTTDLPFFSLFEKKEKYLKCVASWGLPLPLPGGCAVPAVTPLFPLN
jgi:hypothetical protein